MAKTLFNIDNGAAEAVESGGVVTLSFDESLVVGGGKAAGILAIQGKGSIVLSGPLALALGAADLNAALPAALVPAAEVVEGVAEAALATS